MTATQTNAPRTFLADTAARSESIPAEMTRRDSSPLPAHVTSNPRWRNVWATVLADAERRQRQAAGDD